MSKYDKLDDETEHTDTEITLGLRSILGIFFGLVLICGVFFGFGYSLGRSNAVKPSAAPQVNAQAAPGATSPAPVTTVVEQSSSSNSNDPYDFNANSSAAKPSGAVLQPVDPATPAPTASQTPTTPAPDPSGSAASGAATPASAPAGNQQSVTPQATPASYTISNAAKSSTTPSLPLQSASSQSPLMVQVAAISRPQDADVLIAALQKRGFNATARRETSDNLLHIQIGPFASRQQAMAMRARLINDGYNAILK